MPACIIGTWPTPEDSKGEEKPASLGGVEACDGVDNDADGAVDEGCACTVAARGCIGVAGGQCGLGVQRCVSGVWQACFEVGPPYSAIREPALAIAAVTPAGLNRGDTAPLQVVVQPVARCPGIVVPAVQVTLAAGDPVMRVKVTALDNGVGPDSEAGDGLFSAEMPNAFGP
ncbi:MAG: hypothetical protein HYZ27_01795, partial [Deltaproteobacteria bacterium]|nr:hypothetical protein [Deltaproteobacteria bacterium]